MRDQRARPQRLPQRSWQPLAAIEEMPEEAPRQTTSHSHDRLLLTTQGGAAPVRRARQEEGGSGVARAHDGRGREGAVRRDFGVDQGFQHQPSFLGDAAPGLVM